MTFAGNGIRLFLGNTAGACFLGFRRHRPMTITVLPKKHRPWWAKPVAHFDEVGAERAFATFSDDQASMFRDGDLYVFVFDGDGTIVSHGVDESLIGVDATQLADVDGKKFVQEMLSDASMDGTWVDYKWEDPMTGEIEPKSSWVVLHDGYVFGGRHLQTIGPQ